MLVGASKQSLSKLIGLTTEDSHQKIPSLFFCGLDHAEMNLEECMSFECDSITNDHSCGAHTKRSAYILAQPFAPGSLESMLSILPDHNALELKPLRIDSAAV